jgi:hypothetical protein
LTLLFDFARSFAHRGLKGTANYLDLIDGSTPLPGYASGLPLADDERLVGVYENWPGERAEGIVITSHGLLLDTRPGWRRVDFEEIVGYELPDKSTEQTAIPIELRSGETLMLVVRGRSYGESGEGRDVYGMESFLRGVLWTLRRL